MFKYTKMKMRMDKILRFVCVQASVVQWKAWERKGGILKSDHLVAEFYTLSLWWSMNAITVQPKLHHTLASTWPSIKIYFKTLKEKTCFTKFPHFSTVLTVHNAFHQQVMEKLDDPSAVSKQTLNIMLTLGLMEEAL